MNLFQYVSNRDADRVHRVEEYEGTHCARACLRNATVLQDGCTSHHVQSFLNALRYFRGEKTALLQKSWWTLLEKPPAFCGRGKKGQMRYGSDQQSSIRRYDMWPTYIWRTLTAHWKTMHRIKSTQTGRGGSCTNFKNEACKDVWVAAWFLCSCTKNYETGAFD